MQTNKLRELKEFNILFCLIFSIVIFFLYNNISFLNDLLGHLSVHSSVTKPSCEDDGIYFCRPLFVKFLYYFLYNFLRTDLIIFLQVYLLVSTTFLIRAQLTNLNLNNWIINFLCLVLIINPKILKYSFSTMEESFYLPSLFLIISYLIRFILKMNIKNLIYLNLTFALLALIRPAGIVFYFLVILINIFYLIKINSETYKKKILFTLIFFLILISPITISKSLYSYVALGKINSNYFGIQAIGSLISKQKNNYDYGNNDNLSNLINERIIKLNNIREIKKLNLIQNLHFECVIYPAMNHLIFDDPQILQFFKNNYLENLDEKLFRLYIKNFFDNPSDFIYKIHQCFFGNFLMVGILSEKEFDDVKKISINPIFNDNDKLIIASLEKNAKNYGNLIKPIRVISISIFIITIISIITSIKSLVSNRNDKFAILSIIFFCMYYLVINLHVNLILVQTRWFFTYFPLLIFSNLKIIELINLFIIKNKYLNFYLKK